MTRSARLLQLIEALRARRRPVTAAVLADELGVTVRTIYRDVATLAAEGVPIEGEAGIGYVLRPGFLMPPLMFTEEEAEALVLGLNLVIERGDDDLAEAAKTALGRVMTVLPPALRQRIEETGLIAAPFEAEDDLTIDLVLLRDAIRDEHKLVIDYVDSVGERTRRTIWPLSLAFFARDEILVAWCELRDDFRCFRADRMLAVTATTERYPIRRAVLAARWRRREGLDG